MTQPTEQDRPMNEIDHNKIHTIVVKFDCDTPAYHAGMEILGGKIQSVQFDDALLNLENAEEQIEALQVRVAELEASCDSGFMLCGSREAVLHFSAEYAGIKQERDGMKSALVIAEGLAKQNKEMAESFIAVKLERDGLAAKCAELIHYPDCWDTVAYPALQDALNNIDADYQGCTECAEKALAKLKADAVRYRWLRNNGHLDIWWSVEGPADRCANIDADIDTAMGEQQ